MVYTEHIEEIDAPAQLVWSYIEWSNLESLVGLGLFAGVHYNERRPVKGAMRTVKLGNGDEIVEQLQECDQESKFLSYCIIDPGKVPITDYKGEVQITAQGKWSCFVKFSSHCIPVGISETEWQTLYKGMQSELTNIIREQIKFKVESKKGGTDASGKQ